MAYYISCQSSLEPYCLDLIERFALIYSDNMIPRLHLGSGGLELHGPNHLIQTLDSLVNPSPRQGKDLLSKAVLAKQGVQVLDLSGGFGRDAQVMLASGAKVTSLEQHPYMAAMLEELALRLHHPNFKVIWTEAKTYLKQLDADLPDVIYYDPMHPVRQKSAKVKKNLQILQSLIPPADDVSETIALARLKAKKRLVLKWPSKLELPVKSHFCLRGKTIDYAVFLGTE